MKGKTRESWHAPGSVPSTLLVPNLRTQNAKTQTNFSHVIKTIMMLAFLGQKKNSGKPLLKDPSLIDYND